jgi:uroporphyrinogen decarboxylase
MTSKERFLKALRREVPDRLPVTTHHLMPSFLKNCLNGIGEQQFFDLFGLDPIRWVVTSRANSLKGEFYDPLHTALGFLEARRICSGDWQIRIEDVPGRTDDTKRFCIVTPARTLSMVLRSNEHTTWVEEHLIKEKSDIEIIAKYVTFPGCDTDEVNRIAAEFGQRGLIRGHILCFDGFGQPGCWQDFACLYGIENLIYSTFDDPGWVHAFLEVLKERKKHFIRSLKGAKYDILELGGGDASTTVISPDIFEEFVMPYDSELIAEAHEAGQRIVYHTCGGMMPILEAIASMKPDAMETFTPPGMGGDARLSEAKSRIGDKVCLIGGFDQFHFFNGCSPSQTRQEVRRCFSEAGGNGGYILSASDHFFQAEPELIRAYAEEASSCNYPYHS